MTGAQVLRERLAAVRVYLVVTPAAHGSGWEQALGAAVETGLVGMVQLREKHLDSALVVRRSRRVRRLCDAHGALFVLHDRVDLVEDTRADGLHLGQEDLRVEDARSRLGSEPLIGLSTHGVDEVRSARTRPVDYLGLGPCFASGSKVLERAPGGPDLVRRCLDHAGRLPVFVIGGVTPANAGVLAAAGASRVAIGAGVLEAPDPAAAVRSVHGILDP